MRSSETLPSELVHVGSIVELEFVDESEDNTETIRIIDRPGRDGSIDRVPTVSLDSPLGRVILNAKAGDVISYSAPGNVTVKIRVLSVK